MPRLLCLLAMAFAPIALAGPDQPPAAPRPTEPAKSAPVGRPGPAPKPAEEPVRMIQIGAQLIPLGGFDPVPVRPIQPGTLRNLMLPEAIRIGLTNWPTVRVVPGLARADARVGIAIARAKPETPEGPFRAEVMAHVRSIEGRYWALWQAQIALWARETAVRSCEDVLRHETDRPVPDLGAVAEAGLALVQLRDDLVAETSDLMTSERALRDLLGLPADDDRRIIAETPPAELKVALDWEASRSSMLAERPEVAEARRLVAEAAIGTVIDSAGKLVPQLDAEADSRLDRHRKALRLAIHQATQALARNYLEVDAAYNQMFTSQRLLKAARDRLQAQAFFREEGRITVDRLLDAISQHAEAYVQEARFKASYNTAIASFEEAKGTLMTSDGITIVAPAP